MAGIYVHIPFCRSACHYCDFHFSTSTTYLKDMMHAMVEEIINRRDYLKENQVDTIYFGGGTPSFIPAEYINLLIKTIKDHFNISNDPEITLEANPEDIHPGFPEKIMEIGINRLSIGIQSFFDTHLRFLNRPHDAKQAKRSINYSRRAGFKNISIDLIYGFPGLTISKWIKNIETAIDFHVEHLSAYHLTYEPGTVLNYRKDKRRIIETEEQESLKQYKVLTEKMKTDGYLHYEISNFAREGYYSRHNSGYWFQLPYLGIGPSAHSYNGESRQWNTAKNMSYIRKVGKNEKYFEIEVQDLMIQYHDYVMTSLRTMWGIDTEYIKAHFGLKYLEHYTRNARPFLDSGDMKKNGSRNYLSENGMYISDFILKNLFLERDPMII
jgi:oxygen-independent coproporphyrinogen-3 oxidase